MPITGRFWLATSIIIATAASRGLAQDCSPAGTVVQIRASASGTDTITVRYTVVNHSPENLRWISIGAGSDEEQTVAVPAQTPALTDSPPGWRGLIVYPEETAYVHLWWEAIDTAAGIGPGRSLNSFAVRAPGPAAVRPGQIGPYGPVQPIDFPVLPFRVGGSQGGCWWGRVAPTPRQRGS